MSGAGRDLGRELHRARAGTDDGDARTVEGHVVVPRGGVEGGAGEAVATRDVGKLGRLSWPTALTTASASTVSSAPSAVRVTSVHEPSASSHVADTHLGAEPDALAQPELAAQVRK